MPAKIVSCAIAMGPDGVTKLDQFGDQLVARQVIEIGIHSSLLSHATTTGRPQDPSIAPEAGQAWARGRELSAATCPKPPLRQATQGLRKPPDLAEAQTPGPRTRSARR